MKTQLTLALLSPLFLLADVVDMGVIGPTHEIKEKHFIKNIETKLAAIQVGDIKKQLLASVAKKANVKSDLAGCKITSSTKEDNIFVLNQDYKDIGGKVIFAAGKELKRKYMVASSMCVVDGSNLEFAKKSLDKLLEVGTCSKVMVANADFRELKKATTHNTSFYPFHKQLSESLLVDCLPSRAEAYKTSIQIDTIAIEEIK